MKVEKLELVHLAPYLPYGLKCHAMGEHKEDGDTVEPKILTIVGLNNDYVEVDGIRKTISEEISYSDCFPLLYPLSMLTQEITHNGEAFVPMVELLRLKENNTFSKDPLLRSICKDWSQEIVSCKSSTYPTDNVTVHEVEYLARTGNMGTLVYSFTYDDRFDRFSLRDNTRNMPLGVGHQLQLFQNLYEWKFDINGLIDSGLAIPITN